MADTAYRDTVRARALRNAATPAERKLWLLLKNRQVAGAKFSRQMPVGPFFADFLCRERRLIIELDGQGHDQTVAQDAARTDLLERQGYRVLRFENRRVFLDEAAVIAEIAHELECLPTPAFGHPSREREGRQ
jgi:very-short-patch-repair endonuclease